ncbi:Putative oxidoreductase [Klebsiella pneumoniae]|nr:Putative oxidoreductase [Klebsiella pneumoniae]
MNIKIDALNYYGATKKYHLHFRRYGKILKPMW